MSDTKTDFAKVTQMLDAGWHVSICKGGMGTYKVRASHPNDARMNETRKLLVASMAENKSFLRTMNMTAAQAVEQSDYDDTWLITDDFTPEQALTRMAYKVHGEII